MGVEPCAKELRQRSDRLEGQALFISYSLFAYFLGTGASEFACVCACMRMCVCFYESTCGWDFCGCSDSAVEKYDSAENESNRPPAAFHQTLSYIHLCTY